MLVETSFTSKKEALRESGAFVFPLRLQPLAYVLVGMACCALLVSSAMNGFLFFDRLCMATFILLALVGFHFIGSTDIGRKT